VVEPLAAGDYRIQGGALVERKTVADLHGSLARGRLWSQVGRVRDTAVVPFLFVEGDDLDDGPRHPNAIRGCLLAIADLGIAVVRTRDPEDTALWLHRLAVRQQRRSSGSRPAERRFRPSPGVTALTGIPGISEATARALIDRFGTIEQLLAAGPERWADVDGVGPVRAPASYRSRSDPTAPNSAYSSPRSKERCPARRGQKLRQVGCTSARNLRERCAEPC
jgi:ERCC4-type nuclease